MLAGWLYFWCQPERQVRRAQARLLESLESSDFDTLAHMIADDYRDAWGHDKAFVLQKAPQAFGQFLMLDIDREEFGSDALPTGWVLREKLTMKGLGGGASLFVRDRVNLLKGPFTMEWRKQSWKPWDWVLTSVEHPEIEARELDVRF